MSISPAHRAHSADIARNFQIALAWVEQSGILDLIENSPAAQARNPKGAGRPPKLTPYPLKALLVTLTEMALAGQVMSIRTVVHRLNFVYTPDLIEALDTGFFQDRARIAAMRVVSELDPDGRPELPEEERAAFKMWKSEYQRCWKALDDQLMPLDDNVLGAGKARTVDELDKAAKRGGKKSQTDLRERIANRIVASSVEYKNGEFFTHLEPTDLHNGVLRDHCGDLAVDLTPIDVNISRHQGKVPKGKRSSSANQMAAFSPKNRRMRWPAVVGLTLGIIVGRVGSPRVPNVALSIGLSKPSPADRRATILCLDAIEEAGHRPPLAGRAHQYLIGDIAYQDMRHLNEYLIDNKYSAMFKYAKNENTILELRATDPDQTGQDQYVGYLYNGCPMCPLADHATLSQRPALEVPAYDVVNGQPTYNIDELEQHERDVQWFESRRAALHGKPQRRARRRVGRPTRGESEQKQEVSIRIGCPAAAGRIRCPLRKDLPSWKDPNLDIGINPPARPTPLCKAKSVTVWLTDRQVKHIQPNLIGTWEHEENYKANRALNEAFHSQLISPNVGGLRRGQILFRKNAQFTIAVALLVGVANIKALDKWRENLDRHGQSPLMAATERRRIRDLILRNRRPAA
ncbi:hypothetical protein GCM10009821_26360 [Aeromicrobium halocynthiae]|uniref:Transposase n=1 Tax=Aeromicrobium halocynthiae TaxID=560557 RepID=A0ABP5HPR0_9ACTN